MAVDLNDIPTSNTLEFTITFLLNNSPQAKLTYNQANTLDIRFDAIGVGNSEPLSIYRQETPGNITISPGNLAFVDRSVDRKIALRYGTPSGPQRNIVFVLD
ncbi:hypothetical protein [Aquimarina algicola]|uniref:Uncharacterized protein n=1 Tax=Aquimarina algicola TaxID=2589995 RepID=A0A504J8T4_9FLAO|nr:hypothetical protein [Aquimarina algicola]TPN83459.1 hypothetical protein FHK87_19770 [Aquimarina algicola]